jgi:hypothetical protein
MNGGGKVNVTNVLYHGSTHKINKLLPRPSKIIDNEHAVFATNKRWLALVFIAQATDRFLEIGFVGGKGYILEAEPDAFDVYLVEKSGYIYTVNDDTFDSDPRLGMKNHEFISSNEVDIISTEHIPDIYEELKKEDVKLITWEMKEEWIFNI